MLKKARAWNGTLANIMMIVLPLSFLSMIPWTLDRLRSLSSVEQVWRDAFNKLPRQETPGSDRIYYNLAGEAFKRKEYQTALDYGERVIKQNPGAFQGYLALGTSLIALGRLDEAAIAFDKADNLPKPEIFKGYIQFKRCIILELAGIQETGVTECLEKSANQGYSQAIIALQFRKSPKSK